MVQLFIPYVEWHTDVDVGGGFMLGDLEVDDLKCRQICINNQVVVVNIEYRLAPEHPFPRGLEDCWSSVKWVGIQSILL